ncbi:MAG: hypothetical protein JWN71_1972 [Xanthobacteraceae bacterium]|jgi:hypothetical protein|nr:hypothetical protein [Xanthobacteraceae bacterium]
MGFRKSKGVAQTAQFFHALSHLAQDNAGLRPSFIGRQSPMTPDGYETLWSQCAVSLWTVPDKICLCAGRLYADAKAPQL